MPWPNDSYIWLFISTLSIIQVWYRPRLGNGESSSSLFMCWIGLEGVTTLALQKWPHIFTQVNSSLDPSRPMWYQLHLWLCHCIFILKCLQSSLQISPSTLPSKVSTWCHMEFWWCYNKSKSTSKRKSSMHTRTIPRKWN